MDEGRKAHPGDQEGIQGPLSIRRRSRAGFEGDRLPSKVQDLPLASLLILLVEFSPAKPKSLLVFFICVFNKFQRITPENLVEFRLFAQ
jgi:hypothetical protein